jgi:iron complex outermembrane receptor protein
LDVPYDHRYYQYRGAKDMASVYAQEMLALQPDLTLMLNLQYAYNQYHLYDEQYIGTDFHVPYNFLNPRVGLNYNIDDRWNMYVSMGVTSREPRLKNLYDAAEASTPASLGAVVPQFAQNANGTYDFSVPLVTPERLFNLEMGAGLQTETARASANLYWMEFSDEIVKSGRVDRFGQPVTGNADRTRHVGIELAGRWSPLASLEVAGNATVSRNRFIRYTDYSTGSPLRLDENPIAGFPDVLANVRVTYRGNHLSASLLGRFVGKQYTDNFRNEANTVDPYFVSDAWVAYRLADPVDGLWVEARVQVNNMFDVLYAAYGEGDQFFVGAERNVFLTITFGL